MFKTTTKSFAQKVPCCRFTCEPLLVVLVAVNVLRIHRQTEAQVDRLSTMLIENDGVFPLGSRW